MIKKVSVVTDAESWFNEFVPEVVRAIESTGFEPVVVHDVDQIPEGEIAFFLSLTQLVPAEIRRRNLHNIVIHQSALPKGKGWSPVTWQILEGKEEIPVSLIEAADKVDSGTIYLRSTFRVSGSATLSEIRQAQAKANAELCSQFLAEYPEVLGKGIEQNPQEETFYPRRTTEDGRVNIDSSIADVFDLLRVCDPERYPAFFDYRGHRWTLKMERSEKIDD